MRLADGQNQPDTLSERERLAALIAEVGAALIRRESLHEMLQDCAEAVVNHLDAALARIWTVNTGEEILELKASAGIDTHLDGPHSRIPVGSLKIGLIAQERQPYLTNSVLGDGRISDQEWARKNGMVAFAGYPLLVDDRLVGVAAMFSRQPLGPHTLHGLKTIANHIALGIGRKQLEDERQQLFQEAQTLNNLGRRIAGELDLQKLVQSVTDAATELTGAYFGVFFYNVPDERGESHVLFSLSGVPLEDFAHFSMPRAADLLGPAFRAPLRIADVTKDPRFGRTSPFYGMPMRNLPLTSYLAVPVTSRSGEALGGLFLGHPDSGVFAGQHERLATGLAAQAAVAMDNARLFAAAQHSSRQLRESNDRVSNILASIGDGFATIDRQWRYTLVNDRAASFNHKTPAELLGKNVWELFPEAVNTKFYTELHRAMDERVAVHFEERYAPYNVWQEVHAYPSNDGLTVLIQDITERKRFDEHLLQTQKLESLGVLAGGVAHDFNNLLVGILGNASLALETLPASSPEKKMLEDVVGASERAAHLTRQMLAYAGKGRFVVQAVDLSEVVREISRLIQSSIPKNVHLRLDLAVNLPRIEADAAQVQQLVMNLVINAAEAIVPGQLGDVLVTTKPQDVDDNYIRGTFTPGSIAPGTYVSLEVRDTGCGMDQATIAQIFDPFFTTKFTGRGLGLSAALGIVRAHKGTLKIDSTPGQGTTFKILFPAADVEETAPAPTPAPVTWAEKRNGRILVIDDEAVVRRTAKMTLERRGYDVVLAENGAEGCDLFRALANKISVVLLDLTMPGMDGEETLRELKSIRPDVKVLLSSGYNEVEVIQRFTGKGLTGFIQKPYTAAALVEKIRTSL